jgi:sugar lactone lactonase YvrE
VTGMREVDVDWEVVGDTRDRLGESVLWHPRDAMLYWTDFYGPIIRRYDPATGASWEWRLPLGSTIGSLAFAGNGVLLLAREGGIHAFDTANGELKFWADPNEGRPGIGYNDAKVDRDGRYWVGTYDLAEREPRGILYGINPDGRARVGDSGFVICNGPAFSSDGAVMYFSDTAGRRLLAYDLDRANGGLSAPRVLIEFTETEGLPDGLCVDSAGTIYCAHYGGGRITCLSAHGKRLQVLRLPVQNVTSCCLGGPKLDTLYITTGRNGGTHELDGALFACTVVVPGLPEQTFRWDSSV